ncbi:MAG: hypothetical protein R2681_11245 [Pyrinomonadaceae bacterium]
MISETDVPHIISFIELKDLVISPVITDVRTHTILAKNDFNSVPAPQNIARSMCENLIRGTITGNPDDLTAIYSREFIVKKT